MLQYTAIRPKIKRPSGNRTAVMQGLSGSRRLRDQSARSGTGNFTQSL